MLFWDLDGREAAPIPIRCDECVINDEGQVWWPTRPAPSTPSKFQAGVENSVAPVTTIAAARANTIANAKLVGTKTPILPEAEVIVKPLKAGSMVLDLGIGMTHAVQYGYATTQAEKDEHAGGTVTSLLGMTSAAFPIAICGLFDSGMNARVGRAMHVVSDAVAVALAPIDMDQMYREIHHIRIMEAAREKARLLPPATDWSGPECKLDTLTLEVSPAEKEPR